MVRVDVASRLTGRGEVASLKVIDVLTPALNQQAAQLRVNGKGQKERIVLLTADAYAGC